MTRRHNLSAFKRAAALFACATIAACGSPTTEGVEQHTPSQTVNTSVHDMQTLAVEKRVAFMTGHVEAGLALFRAGAPEQAAKHLLHPVSETHASERAGIEALGFDQSLFVQVSDALAQGRPASEIEPQLAAVEANMALLQKNAGGNPRELIAYLMDMVIEEYKIGVTDGAITDPGEYQDAFGFTVVALDLAELRETNGPDDAIAQLRVLLAMWPDDGPLANSVPTAVSDVVAQAEKVKLVVDR